MAKRILNWGLLSTANINSAVMPAIQVSKRNHLLAVGSRTQESADHYASQWKIPRAHGSYEALLADPEIDVIYNSLPNHLHVAWTIKALEAGKHVLCEKPIALNKEDVDTLKAAAHQHGRVVAEAYMYRHHPQTLKVQELIKSGTLGTLKLIRGSFSYMIEREGNIRLDPAMGGGSLWDVGGYPISYARSVIGANPLEVFGWQVIGPSGTDDTFIGQLQFDHDIYAQFDCSFAMSFRALMEFTGSEGTLTVPDPYKPYTNEKIHITRGDNTETMKVKGEETYLGEVEDMADAILLGKEPRISLEDSRANIAVVLALFESARTGKSVKPVY